MCSLAIPAGSLYESCVLLSPIQFFYVIKGRLLFRIGRQEYRVNQRTTVHVPEGAVAYIKLYRFNLIVSVVMVGNVMIP